MEVLTCPWAEGAVSAIPWEWWWDERAWPTFNVDLLGFPPMFKEKLQPERGADSSLHCGLFSKVMVIRLGRLSVLYQSSSSHQMKEAFSHLVCCKLCRVRGVHGLGWQCWCMQQSGLQLLSALQCCQLHCLTGGRQALTVQDLRGINVMRKLDWFCCFLTVSVLAEL